MSMEISGESPSKRQAKSSVSEQGAETKTASSSFGSSTPFTFKPANDDTSHSQKSQSSQPFGGLFQPKQLGIDRSATPASNLFQPSDSADKEASQEQPAKSPAAIFNFFPNSKEPAKKLSESPVAQSSTPTFNPFATLKPAEKSTAEEAKPATPFVLGAPPGAPQTESMEKGTQQKAQEAAPFNPFKSFQSNEKSNDESQPPERNSVMNSFQPSRTNDSTLFSAFQPSQEAGPEKSHPSKLFNATRPSESTGAEKSQAPAPFNPFQSLKSTDAEKPMKEPTGSSASATNTFSTSKLSGEEMPDMAKSPSKLASNNNSAKLNEGGETTGGDAATSPLKANSLASASTPVFERPQSMMTKESPFKVNGAQTGTIFGPTAEQPKNSSTETTPRAPSQTSNLFARSLGQASSASKSGAEPVHPQSHDVSQEYSPTKATSVPQRTVGNPSITTTLLGAASDPLLVKVKSHGASNVPQDLDNDDFVDFDKSYRLRNLNAKLKKQIADLDPVKHDFEPIIRFYATQRAAIGYPIGGLYHRVKAGEKRKTQEAGHDEPIANAAKRARIESSATSSSAEADRPVFSFSAITSVSTTPQPATAVPSDVEPKNPFSKFNYSTTGSTAAQPAAATSNTSNVFKSILSSSDQRSSQTQERSAGFFPSKAAPSVSASKPQEQGAQSSPSMFTSTNNKTPIFLLGSQPNKTVTPFSTSNGSPASSQLFQPKPATASTLEPPKFASAGGTDFMNAFAAQAKRNAARMEAENKAKRKAEEFDSDEDDEAEYERRVAEEDRAKRAKIEALSKAGSGFTPVLSSASSANGVSSAAEQDGESNRDASGEESERSENDQELESEECQNEDAQGDEDYEEDGQEGEETDDDDIQAAMAKSHAKAKNPFDSSSDQNSLFNRITRPDPSSEQNGIKIETASPAILAANSSVLSAPLGTGLFGSRPTTPNQDSLKPFGTSIFSNIGSHTPTGDHTWKPGSAIKFGSPTAAPTVNITPATPLAKTNGDSTHTPFSTFSAAASTASKPTSGTDNETPKASSSLFGASSFAPQAGGTGIYTSQPFGSLFGDSKKTTVNQSSAAQVGFSFGGPHKPGAFPLLAPSNVSSAITSRATSPGLTDNESAAESATDDQANEPQPDYMASRPGEENEDVLFEVRTKVLEYKSEKELSEIGSKDESGWKTRGLGPLRVLRNSETGRTRIVMRSEPGANVIINSPLIQDNKYDVNPSGKEGASLKTGIFMDGKLKNWVFKVKTIKIANELVDYLKENERSPMGQKRLENVPCEGAKQ